MTSTNPSPSPSPRSSTPSIRGQSSSGASPQRVPSDSSFHSPARHHHRVTSATRPVKETRNARSQYSNSEDDGTSQLRINQYVIQQEIGRGSFGAVHLATDQYGQEYAVKEFSKTRLRRRAKSNMLRRPRQRQANPTSPSAPHPSGFRALLESRFTRPHTGVDEVDNSFDLIKEEIAIMKKLNHPNLVSLIEVLDDPEGDSLFMVLEMCKKGVIMKVEIDQAADPYPDEACRLWFRDLMLGIEYLHSQGIVHRDIKPDNCLLTQDDTLKIVDFGVSEMFEKASEMRLSKSAGSPAFMAPELCVVNHGIISGKPADIWSMGVTLYCMKFGCVPYRKDAVLELYQSIVDDPIPIPPDCDSMFADLISRLLEKDPEKRITMQELREHPWVTKNGEDPLLSEEENCAAMVSQPTDDEMDAAITSNMARVMAIMKAVNRFKALIHRDRQDIVNSFLGHATKIVKPPGRMTKEEMDAAPNAEPTLDDSAGPESDIETAKRKFLEQGDALGAELAAKIEKLPKSLRQFLISEHRPDDMPQAHPQEAGPQKAHVESPTDTATASASAASAAKAACGGAGVPPPLPPRKTPAPAQTMPEAISSLHYANRDELDETRIAPLIARHTQQYPGKGHAHDPLEDQLFLNIGLGPSTWTSKRADPARLPGTSSDEPASAMLDDPSEGSTEQFISESPTATDDNIYEEAYAKQVSAIRKERGTETTVYLTRRVGSGVADALDRWQLSPEKIMANLPASESGEGWRKRDRARHGFATAVKGAMNKATKYADDAERKMEEKRQQRMHPSD